MFGETTTRVARALAVAGFLLLPGLAHAQVDFGVRGGFYNDADAGFIGAEILTASGFNRQIFFNPNVEYVFVDDGSLTTVNLDLHYDLHTRSAPYSFWLGGGAALLFNDFDDEDDTDFGLNLLAGVGFWPRQTIRPYVQGKVILSNNTEAVLGFGVRFP
jgi:hypothetical protein